MKVRSPERNNARGGLDLWIRKEERSEPLNPDKGEVQAEGFQEGGFPRRRSTKGSSKRSRKGQGNSKEISNRQGEIKSLGGQDEPKGGPFGQEEMSTRFK